MKIYERTIPNRMMSDGLKNNHLEEAALSLVCSVDDIEKIWQMLKYAYGNSKLFLKKKLSEIHKIIQL